MLVKSCGKMVSERRVYLSWGGRDVCLRGLYLVPWCLWAYEAGRASFLTSNVTRFKVGKDWVKKVSTSQAG